MTVRRGMIDAPFTAKPDQTIGDVISLFSEKHVRAVPVVNDDGILLGLISLRMILKNVLPLAATIDYGIDNLDFLSDTTEGAAKKLKKILPRPVSDFMDENCECVDADTSKWEAIRVMVKSNTILPVIDKKTRKLLGIMSAQSTLQALKETMADIEAEKSGEENND